MQPKQAGQLGCRLPAGSARARRASPAELTSAVQLSSARGALFCRVQSRAQHARLAALARAYLLGARATSWPARALKVSRASRATPNPAQTQRFSGSLTGAGSIQLPDGGRIKQLAARRRQRCLRSSILCASLR